MKLKNLLLLFLFVVFAVSLHAQNKVGDNPAVIQAGSLLELESLTKGLRLPRITLNDVSHWTLDGTPASGMMIFNESGSEPKGIYYWSTESSQWIRVVNKTELSTLIANYFNQNTTVRDSIVKLINTTITSGTLKGKDLTSNSPVLKVLNGTGAIIKEAQVDIDKFAFGHLLRTAPVSDSLSVAISTNPIIRDSIKSVVNATTTNTLSGISGKLTSTVNGVPAYLTPTNGTITKSLGFDASGNLVIAGSSPTSNTLDNTTNTIISNVNGVIATTQAVNAVANTASGNLLSTTVNGISGVSVNIINDNTLSLTNGVLASSVNGVSSLPGLNLVSTVNNGLSGEKGNAQLGGPLIIPTTLTTTATNTFSITGLQDGDVITDGLLTVTPDTGILRKISGNMLGTNVSISIAIAAVNGQKRFATPLKITDIKKLQVYRNGINVEFILVDDTHIDLEDGAVCYIDDEIKIIQLK